jgi:hypothetical protein
VYRRSAEGEPVFVEVPAPTDQAPQAVLHKIITRMMKLLTRRGALVDGPDSTYMADNDADLEDARTLRPLQAAACTYRIAFGPRAGQKVLTWQGAMPRQTDFKHDLCADIHGFSLHAAVRCGAGATGRLNLSSRRALARAFSHACVAQARAMCEPAAGSACTTSPPP